MIVRFRNSAQRQISANITRYAQAHKMEFIKQPSLSFGSDYIKVTFSILNPDHENKMLAYLSKRNDFLGFVR